LGADRYISGPHGRDYLDTKKIESANIELVFADFKHPVYSQQYEGFVPNLSAIDLLFNCGPESLKILMGNV
jgi:hypothetical protein